MTYATKALLRYGPLCAGALVCAALAGLGRFRVSPLLSGKVQIAALVALAIAMVIQGAAIFPRKWASRLVISPHALLAGSLMLFAGAALLLAMLFAGCAPATAKAAPPQSTIFTAPNEQFRGTCFALASLEALKRN
jgi:hypothetical protein